MVLHVSENWTPYKIICFAICGLSSSGKRVQKYYLARRTKNQGSHRWERERLRRQKAEFKTQFMSPLHQRTTDSLQSAPLSLKPGSTLVDNLWTLMDNWWTGDGCQPFHIRFLFRQCQCQPELYWQTIYKRQSNYNDNDNGNWKSPSREWGKCPFTKGTFSSLSVRALPVPENLRPLPTPPSFLTFGRKYLPILSHYHML